MTTNAGVSILVVDDEPEARRFSTRLLEQQGFQCSEATSAIEALDALAEERPQIVLTRVTLPGPSGITLVNALSPLRPDVESIVITGRSDPDAAYSALDAGASGYVRDTFDSQELLAAVNSALRRRTLAIDGRDRRAELETELDQSRVETVERLARAVESRDEETGAHVDRMSTLASRLASRLGWSAADAETLRMACVLHDVGKVAIPDRVLLKRGKLTKAERQLIETHCEAGHAILAGAKSELLRLAATVAWTHHERIDGSGYPHGLVGDEIPLAGRIAAVADVYDALTSDRPYRSALDRGEALEIIRRDRGLDDRVVATLEHVVQS